MIRHTLFALALVGCSSEAPRPASDDAGTTEADAATGDDAGAAPDSAALEDAGGDAATSDDVVLTLDNPIFTNAKAVNGGYAYVVKFRIHNSSTRDVLSLDTMTYDFGAQTKVSLVGTVCGGMFPIPANGTRLVDTQVGTNEKGDLVFFSIMCGNKQSIGGAKGAAPASGTFPGPIDVTVGGKTSQGSYAASGKAIRQ